MKFVKANGLVIHYLDQGRRDGPPLVFINSLGTDFRIWNEVAEISRLIFDPHLRQARPRAVRIRPDKNDIADYARDLVAFWTHWSLDARRSSDCPSEASSRRSFIVRIRSASRRSCSATPRRRSEPTRSGTSASPQVERGGIEALADAPATVVLSPFPRCAVCRACRHARHAHPNAETGLSRRLRRLEARRPPTYAGRIRAPTLCLVGDQDGSTPVALVKETAAYPWLAV